MNNPLNRSSISSSISDHSVMSFILGMTKELECNKIRYPHLYNSEILTSVGIA